MFGFLRRQKRHSEDTVQRPEGVSELDWIAARRCVTENAKWTDPMDWCMLPAGTCPVCQEYARKELQCRND